MPQPNPDYWAGDPRSHECRPGKGARRTRRRRSRWRQAMAPLSCSAMPSTEGSGAAADNTRGCRHPGAPAPENTLRSLITFSQTPKGGEWVFFFRGRPPSGAPVSPGTAAPLVEVDAHIQVRNTHGGSFCTGVWYCRMVALVMSHQSGTPRGAPRTVPSSSGHIKHRSSRSAS